MKTPARVWILSELYRPELTSTGYFVSEIAEHLAYDFEVNVICSQPSYASRGERAPALEDLNGVRVERVWSPIGRRSLLARVIDMLGFSVKALFRVAHAANRGDVILAVSNPPLLPYIAAFVSGIKKAKFVLLIQDVYPEVLLSTGFLERNSIFFRILDSLSLWLYRRTDRILVLGRDMRELIANKLPEADSRLVIIENWADLDEIAFEPRSTTVPIVLQHAGNMGRTHDLAILIEAAATLPDTVRLEFIGNGSRVTEVANAIGAYDNMTLAPYRPRCERSRSLSDCDVAVISFLPGMAGVSVPSRMYNVMASGRPLIGVCEPHSELARIICEHKIGWVVLPGDLVALTNLLRAIATSPSVLSAKGERARTIAEAKYAKQSLLPQYAAVIGEMTRA